MKVSYWGLELPAIAIAIRLACSAHRSYATVGRQLTASLAKPIGRRSFLQHDQTDRYSAVSSEWGSTNVVTPLSEDLNAASGPQPLSGHKADYPTYEAATVEVVNGPLNPALFLEVFVAKPVRGTPIHHISPIGLLTVLPGQMTPLREFLTHLFNSKRCSRFYQVRSAFPPSPHFEAGRRLLKSPHSLNESLQAFSHGFTKESLFVVARTPESLSLCQLPAFSEAAFPNIYSSLTGFSVFAHFWLKVDSATQGEGTDSILIRIRVMHQDMTVGTFESVFHSWIESRTGRRLPPVVLEWKFGAGGPQIPYDARMIIRKLFEYHQTPELHIKLNWRTWKSNFSVPTTNKRDVGLRVTASPNTHHPSGATTHETVTKGMIYAELHQASFGGDSDTKARSRDSDELTHVGGKDTTNQDLVALPYPNNRQATDDGQEFWLSAALLHTARSLPINHEIVLHTHESFRVNVVVASKGTRKFLIMDLVILIENMGEAMPSVLGHLVSLFPSVVQTCFAQEEGPAIKAFKPGSVHFSGILEGQTKLNLTHWMKADGGGPVMEASDYMGKNEAVLLTSKLNRPRGFISRMKFWKRQSECMFHAPQKVLAAFGKPFLIDRGVVLEFQTLYSKIKTVHIKVMGDVQNLTLRNALDHLLGQLSVETSSCPEIQELNVARRISSTGKWGKLEQDEDVLTLLDLEYLMRRGWSIALFSGKFPLPEFHDRNDHSPWICLSKDILFAFAAKTTNSLVVLDMRSFL